MCLLVRGCSLCSPPWMHLSVLETDVKEISAGGGTALAWWALWHSKYGELFLFLMPSEAFPKCSEGVWVFYFDRHEKKQTQLYLLQSVARYFLSKTITLLSQMARTICSYLIISHRVSSWCKCNLISCFMPQSNFRGFSYLWMSTDVEIAPKVFGLLLMGSPSGGSGTQ